MIAATEEFREAVRSSARVAVSIDVREPGGSLTPAPIVEGAVNLDGQASTRASVSLTAVSEEFVPIAAGDPLAPYGNELVVQRGIEYPNGDRELIPLGVFGIRTSDVNDAGTDLPIALTCLDRSARIIDAAFEEPYQVTSGTPAGEAILDALLAGWPGMPYYELEFDNATISMPLLTAQEQDDRWDFAQGMAEAAQCRLYFDGEGIARLMPIARGAAAISTIEEGDGGNLLSIGKSWTREDAFNAVIVTGENTDGDPVRGVARDENPLSPTYYYGAFGRVPRFYSSQYVTTDSQAADVAANILALEMGTTQSISFGALTDPTLEPHDVVRVRRERLGVDEDHTIDQLAIPLAPAAMSGSTRATPVMEAV